MEVSFDLTIAWALLLAFATFVYVVLDGFDLGIGILYPFFPEKSDRDLMMNSVAPVWDGNETWLILGGGGLFAAFPLAYAIILPAVYVPIIVMLLALIFRGVAFEFRWRSQRRFSARAWDMSFICGSVVAALMQGVRGSRVRKLVLTECGVTDAGAAAVAGALPGSALEELWLSGNRIGPAGCRALVDGARGGRVAALLWPHASEGT